MRVYHTTAQPDEVLRFGFRESVGTLSSGRQWAGVWLTDRPMESGDAAYLHGATLELDIPEEVLDPYEWKENDKPYRSFLVPAHIADEALAASRHLARPTSDDPASPAIP